jgi:hypothetical protein
LVYAVDVNLLGGSIDTIKKKPQTLINVSKEVGLEVNVSYFENPFNMWVLHFG